MEGKNQYNPAADVLRIIAILAVVCIHTTTKTLAVSSFNLQELPLSLFLNQGSRFAVPLFFLISGFVLELNYHRHEAYIKYLKKRLSRIFVPYVFWSAIYCFFVYPKPIGEFLSALINGTASYQLYFIPALLIFYLLFPLIHNFCEFIVSKWIVIVFGLIQLVVLYYDYSVHPLSIYYPARVALMNFFPFFLGIVLVNNQTRFLKFINKWKLILLLGSIVFAGFAYYEGLSGYLETHNYRVIYSSWRPSILIYTIFLAGFLYWLFDRKNIKTSMVKAFSRLSFFVFFIHVIILEVVWYAVAKNVFLQTHESIAENLWYDPLFFIIVTIISFFLAFIAHKIPKFSKLSG